MMHWENGAEASPPAWQYNNYYSHGHPVLWGNTVAPGEFWIFGILMVICWITFIILMIALIRWLWIKGNKEKRNR